MFYNLIPHRLRGSKNGSNGDCTQKESIKSYGLFPIVLTLVIFGFGLLVLFAWLWAHRIWPGLTIDEMVFHLTAPVEGTGGGIFLSLFLQVFLPAAIIEACVVFFSLLIRKKYQKASKESSEIYLERISVYNQFVNYKFFQKVNSQQKARQVCRRT